MSTENSPVVRLSHADITNGGESILFDVNLTVSQGDFVYIVGKVGTGKTSLLRSLNAQNPLSGGEGTCCGLKLNSLSDSQISQLRRKLGVVFQDFQLLWDRTVHDNLDFVLKATGWKSQSERENTILDTLRAVGMENKVHRFPHQLSGGEQQRVCLARAILNGPQLILADEPTGHLDPATADDIMNLLYSLNKTKGTSVIIITHDMDLVTRFPGEVYLCENQGLKKLQ